LALVTTSLRRSELCALDWRDLDLDGREPTLLVRRGKGSKPRRQSLPPGLASELRRLRRERAAPADAPVFCGLAGRRLQETTLAEEAMRPRRGFSLRHGRTAQAEAAERSAGRGDGCFRGGGGAADQAPEGRDRRGADRGGRTDAPLPRDRLPGRGRKPAGVGD